jgi:hypothetical protein
MLQGKPQADAGAQLQLLIDNCIFWAREEGWRGRTCDFELTECDCEYVVDALGYKPSRALWAECGFDWVGDAHCAEGEPALLEDGDE